MSARKLLRARPELEGGSALTSPALDRSQACAQPSCGTSTPHESAVAQVAGAATYVDDIPEVRGTLYAAPILSTVAHGKLRAVDASAALVMPGVRDVLLAKDIPGHTMLASFIGDEPIFAMETVQHIGQVVGLVVADSVLQARHAARKVKLDIEALPAILTIKDALREKSYVLPPVFVRRGDAAQALSRAAHTLSGTLEVGGQEHFYLEGQVAYVLPQEQNQWHLRGVQRPAAAHNFFRAARP